MYQNGIPQKSEPRSLNIPLSAGCKNMLRDIKI